MKDENGKSGIQRKKPGADGEVLCPEDRVHRVLRQPEEFADGQILPSAFELSSQEKKSARKSISAWESSLTTPIEAVKLVGNPKRSVVLTFAVELLHSVQFKGSSLSAVWEPIEGSDDGIGGHCGIVGLGHDDKVVRKNLRRELTKVVNERKLAVQKVRRDEKVQKFFDQKILEFEHEERFDPDFVRLVKSYWDQLYKASDYKLQIPRAEFGQPFAFNMTWKSDSHCAVLEFVHERIKFCAEKGDSNESDESFECFDQFLGSDAFARLKLDHST